MTAGGLERLAAWVAIFFTCLTAAGWTCVLFSSGGWQKKTSLWYSIDISLHRATIDAGVVSRAMEVVAEKAALPDGVKQTLQQMPHLHTDMMDLAHRMCQLPKIGGDYCAMWSRVRMSSMTFITVGPIGVFGQLLAAAGLHVYWNKKPSPLVRRVYTGLLIAAPTIYFALMAQYIILTWQIPEFPPKAQSSTWSFCMMIAFMMLFFTFVPIVLVFTLARKAIDEQLTVARKHLKEAEKDASMVVEMSSRPGANASQANQSNFISAHPGSNPHMAAPGSGYNPQAAMPGSGYGQQAPPLPGSGYNQQSWAGPPAFEPQQQQPQQQQQQVNAYGSGYGAPASAAPAYGYQQQMPPAWG